MAMLEDLEKGLRRAQATERFVDLSFGRGARPGRKRQGGSGSAARRAQIAMLTFDRSLAIIVFLWVASVIWCLLFGLGVESGTETPVAEIPESAHAATLRQRSIETGLLEPLSVSGDAEAAVAKEGLSAAEFEREVRRVFSQNRKRAQGAGSETDAADYPTEPDYAFPLAKGESLPEPLAPPTVVKAQPTEVSPVEPVAQPVEMAKPRVLKVVKSKAAAEKAAKAKCVKKPTAPSPADHEQKGPSSLLAAATETISGVIRNWSR
jgi:hypothetical protein